MDDFFCVKAPILSLLPMSAPTRPLIYRWHEGARCQAETARLRPMNARVDHLIDEALALAPDERSAVVIALLDSLDGEDEATVAKAWANEIRQRKSDLRAGAAKAVPWAEARSRLNDL